MMDVVGSGSSSEESLPLDDEEDITGEYRERDSIENRERQLRIENVNDIDQR